MTSEVVIRNSTLRRSGDKGVSIGEGSTVLLRNNIIEDCAIGVQVKDSSRATIIGCDLVRNGAAVDAYKKNWRYGTGGDAFLYNCWIEENESTLTADKESRIFVHDSWIDKASTFKKRIQIDEYVDMGTDPDRRSEFRAQDTFRFPEDDAATTELFTSFWPPVHLTARGARMRER